MKRPFLYLLFFLLPILFISCVMRKKMIYFQGETNSSEANKNYNPVFHTDDLLSITVTGMDAETVKPFNLPNTSAMGASGYSLGSQTPMGYLIDTDGNLDFPLIGKIKVAGLTRTAVVDTLKNRLKPYLSNTTIIIRIVNFKITVLGEVRNPGSFTIPNERVTLPEAIGIAGDLLITGKRKNVLVIRDNEGTKTNYTVDLTSKDLFTSPVYYLNQNDVVYIEPNRSKINSSAINQSNAAILLSVTSFLFTLVVFLRNQ